MSNLVFGGAGHVFPRAVRDFNMLWPARWQLASESPGYAGSINVRNWIAASYFKDWLPWNLKFRSGGADVDTVQVGAFTTAPDGTTDTARLWKEAATDGEHSIMASSSGLHNQFIWGRVRHAGVFKYAGRRIVMTLFADGHEVALPYGCRATFDLQTGTVVSDTAVFGDFTSTSYTYACPGKPDPTWEVSPAQIRAVGNGWYLCYFDAIANSGRTGAVGSLFCKVSLDSGTGGDLTPRTTYVGDGISGVYGWRANLLPARAWDLNRVDFFDDFDSIDTIDMTNSKAPGFKWYMNNPFPGWDYVEHPGFLPFPEAISVENSILRNEGSFAKNVMSAASTWDHPLTDAVTADGGADRNYSTGYVGKGWVAPFLMEFRTAYDLNRTQGHDAVPMWGTSLEWLCWGRQGPAHDPPILGRESDYYEMRYGSLFEFNLHHLYQGDIASNASNPPPIWLAPTIWGDHIVYQPGALVERLGNYYFAIRLNNNPNPDNPAPPESSPLDWALTTTYVNASVMPPIFDPTQFYDYAVMWFPWTPDEPGQILGFHDGKMSCWPLTYGPEFISVHSLSSSIYHLSDWQQQPLFIGAMEMYYLDVDWVRVTQ